MKKKKTISGVIQHDEENTCLVRGICRAGEISTRKSPVAFSGGTTRCIKGNSNNGLRKKIIPARSFLHPLSFKLFLLLSSTMASALASHAFVRTPSNKARFCLHAKMERERGARARGEQLKFSFFLNSFGLLKIWMPFLGCSIQTKTRLLDGLAPSCARPRTRLAFLFVRRCRANAKHAREEISSS